MKPMIVAAGLAFSLVAATLPHLSAAQAGPSQERIQRRADHLAEKLSLTDAQTLEVQAIFTEQAAIRREMHQRHKAERKALREQGDAKLSQALSAEQKAQLDELRAERRERGQARREHRRMRGTCSEE